jgi:hypothetical protein
VRVYEQAIIIDEPWLSKILAGNKAWEMRSRPTNIRGPIGLILKRSQEPPGAPRAWSGLFPHFRCPTSPLTKDDTGSPPRTRSKPSS